MDRKFYSLGLMSGTSMDGIDASIIYSNGVDILEVLQNMLFKIYKIRTLLQLANRKYLANFRLKLSYFS